MNRKTDILIVGSGVAGLYCALNLPADKNIIVVTKDKAHRSDSYLAQGGICVLRDEGDMTLSMRIPSKQAIMRIIPTLCIL